MNSLRSIVRQSRPTAAVELLRVLGWCDDDARIDHVPGTPESYSRLVLGNQLTGAGTQSIVASDLWWTGFQQGVRYHVAVVDSRVYWYDFNDRKEWICPWDGDLTRLQPLSPAQFANTGLFSPAGATGTAESLPPKPPREYLTDVVKEWWRRYLKHGEIDARGGALEQRSFVNLIARLVLIRTIEDIGGSQSLRPETLRSLARSPQDSTSALMSLFEALKTSINSQVFSGNATTPLPAETVSQLIPALYELNDRQLDFAAIEFNMIGRFYERVLGDHHEITPARQLSLIGPQERDVTPVSHRRELGQYYTPRVFADYLARKTVLPLVRAAQTVDELPVVADIAVGSGEMLNAALRAMLSVPKFRNPMAVRHILTNKLIGVDINPTATQLTALNLLRTAVLLCPELLAQSPALPHVGGLYDGSVGDERIRKNIGNVDVVMTNPPFRGLPDWQSDVTGTKTKRIVKELGRHANKASVFLIRAAGMLRAGGMLGIVLPNQFFTSKGNASVRNQLADDLDLLEIVDNQGSRIFDGVSNQPGMLIAAMTPKVRAPSMLLTTLAPRQNQDRAALATGLDNSPGIRRITVDKPAASAATWFESSGPRATILSVSDRKLVSLGDQITLGVFRAPILSIGPLGDLWTIERTPKGEFRHAISGVTVNDDSSPYVKRLAQPKHAGSVLLHSFYDAERRVVFPYVPTDTEFVSQNTDKWRKANNTIWKMCGSIVEVARGSMPFKNHDHRRYQELLASGEMRYFRLNAFDPRRQYLLLSRMARIQHGNERWSGWAFAVSDGVVPVSGLFAHTKTLDQARMLVALLNTKHVFEQLRQHGTARGAGWVEVSPNAANKLLIPNMDDPSIANEAKRLRERINAYITGSDRDFGAVVAAAEKLWPH